MRVRYTPEAFSDRERILEYLRERSASGSRNVAASIRKAIAQLGDQPHSGYRTDNPDVRVMFVVRYPYKIFYRVRDDMVEILHIRHTSRRAWKARNRGLTFAAPRPARSASDHVSMRRVLRP